MAADTNSCRSEFVPVSQEYPKDMLEALLLLVQNKPKKFKLQKGQFHGIAFIQYYSCLTQTIKGHLEYNLVPSRSGLRDYSQNGVLGGVERICQILEELYRHSNPF